MSRKNKVHVTMRDWRSGRGFGKEKARLERLERQAPLGLCGSLRRRVCYCCQLAGVGHEYDGTWLKCHMPGGEELVLYGWPTTRAGVGKYIYGHIVRTAGERRITEYILEPEALYMYELLGRKAVELERKYGKRNGKV